MGSLSDLFLKPLEGEKTDTVQLNLKFQNLVEELYNEVNTQLENP